MNTIETKLVVYFFIKLGRHGERIGPIDFGGQRSRSQWTRMEKKNL